MTQPSVVVFGGLVGMVAGALGQSRPVSAIAGASIGAYLVVAWTPVADLAVRAWMRVDVLPAQAPGAVVVLSSGVLRDSSLDREGADRLLTGLELAKGWSDARLVTTRVVIGDGVTRLTSDVDQRRLARLAGLETRHEVVGDVANTRDEARRAASLLLPEVRRVAVVTSPLHTRRACAMFEAEGFTVTCVAARVRAFVTREPHSSGDRLALFGSWFYELMATGKWMMTR